MCFKPAVHDCRSAPLLPLSARERKIGDESEMEERTGYGSGGGGPAPPSSSYGLADLKYSEVLIANIRLRIKYAFAAYTAKRNPGIGS